MGDLTRDFSVADFACKDGTAVPPSCRDAVWRLAENLQVLRDDLGACIYINSAYRSPSHNAVVGGVENSEHVKGMAVDLYVDELSGSA